MTYSSPLKAATAALALCLAGTTGAQAQQDSDAQAQQGSDAQAQQDSDAQAQQDSGAQAQQDYSDAKLEAFVTAALQVSEMRGDVQKQLKSAESEEERQQVVADANKEIRGVVKSTEGISVQEYAEIGKALGNDEELSTRVGALVKEKRGAAE